MTDLVSTRLQAPADGNVPSHKAPFRKKTRTWQTCEKKMFPNEKKERKKIFVAFCLFWLNDSIINTSSCCLAGSISW